MHGQGLDMCEKCQVQRERNAPLVLTKGCDPLGVPIIHSLDGTKHHPFVTPAIGSNQFQMVRVHIRVQYSLGIQGVLLRPKPKVADQTIGIQNGLELGTSGS